MNKIEEKSLLTRNNIIVSFWSLMDEKNINQITIKEITERAGIYRSTFYLHYTDIYQLLDQEENKLINQWEEVMYDFSIEDGVEALIPLLADFYESHSDRMFLLLEKHGDRNYEKKMKATIYKRMKEVLNIDTDSTFDFVFEFYITAIISTMSKWYMEKNKTSLEQIIIMVHELIENGLQGFGYSISIPTDFDDK